MAVAMSNSSAAPTVASAAPRYFLLFMTRLFFNGKTLIVFCQNRNNLYMLLISYGFIIMKWIMIRISVRYFFFMPFLLLDLKTPKPYFIRIEVNLCMLLISTIFTHITCEVTIIDFLELHSCVWTPLMLCLLEKFPRFRVFFKLFITI